MKMPSTAWWTTDVYDGDVPLPADLRALAPFGPALVHVYPDGRTQPGWGGQDKGSGSFMANFTAGRFSHRTKVHALKTSQKPFAFVMRSFKALVIDIDGKNGGLQGVGKLGLLPKTLAETSKSGNGYHLFYEMDDTWDEDEGFAALSDAIGIVPGVDIRVTGCVYHYAQQRWNDRPIAPAPQHLIQMLQNRSMTRAAAADRIVKIINEGDDMDVAMLHNELEKDLAKPMAQGGRNNTLFAIGAKMLQAGMDWEKPIRDRAHLVGLFPEEADKLVANINKYGPNEKP